LVGGFLLLFPPSPDPVEILLNENNKQDNSYYTLNEKYWKIKNNSLLFIGGTELKQEVQVYSQNLPGKNKKPGYITSKVTIDLNQNFSDSLSVFGFQLGGADAVEEDQLIMGINTNGDVKVCDGNLNKLSDEKVKIYPKKINTKNNSVTISFHYYRNPFGWVVFCSIYDATDPEINSQIIINNIPVKKLSSYNKKLSLIAFDPSGLGAILFSDWQIQKNWTPND